MDRRTFLGSIVAGAVAPAFLIRPQRSPAWKAGVATINITPDRSLWMAGFARRKQASQGVSLPLHAKALALQAGTGNPVVLVTTDLLGLTARITDRVSAALQQQHRIRRADLLFNASHTHCGPVVDEQLSVAYDLTPEQWADIRSYSEKLEEQLIAVVSEALKRLAPARVGYSRGEATFAANRRVSFKPLGPVDHSVPILRIDNANGTPVAMVFGYACHNTTLGDAFVQYHGDYAGVAQAELEKRHQGATALFVAGCGADANPSPRGTPELVQSHGVALADAVDRALPSATAIASSLRTSYGTVDLPFVGSDARERWKQQLKVDSVYLQRYDALMARQGPLPTKQPDPVQVWRFGPALSERAGAAGESKGNFTMVALGGEVVVDYALRLAGENKNETMWVAGYSNDVFGYVPSLRVLREGGYEGADAMIYYGRPGPFTEEVEELIVGKVRELMSRA
ncbi:MAG: neutral/alkaline non-lysosomal ceramidase N-terminal domain-containing protein [Vicinamibacterales bacterium]